MKQILFLSAFCITVSYAGAQTLTPEVISTAGTSFVNGSNVLDWTLGEPVTATLNNGSNQMSQGFHQNDMLITAIDSPENSTGITVFPNPTADIVNIEFAKSTDNNTIELFSAEGKLVLSQSTGSNTAWQLNMNAFANGVYLLKIKNKTSKGNSFQIIKNK